ncbi:unnamed protein product [Caenorhabditis brenneri]
MASNTLVPGARHDHGRGIHDDMLGESSGCLHVRKAITKAGLVTEPFTAQDWRFLKVFQKPHTEELHTSCYNHDFPGKKLKIKASFLRYGSFNDFKRIVANVLVNKKKKNGLLLLGALPTIHSP